MRVLHVIPSVAERSGGPATAIVPMCRALQQHGVEVVLITTDAGMDEMRSGGKPPFLTCSSLRDLGGASSARDLEGASSARDSEGASSARDSEEASAASDLEAASTTPSQEQVRKGGLPPLVDYKGVPAKIFPSQLGDSFKYSRPLTAWLNTHAHKFDLVHIHAVFNHSSVAAAHVCRKAGVPYVVRPLGTLEPWSMTQKSLRKRVFWQVAGKAMLRGASAIHYTTDAEKVSTEGLLGLNHGKVIGLGVEIHPCGEAKLADHFPALTQKPYALVMSRLHPKKGLDVLIDAFLSMVQNEKFAHWRLVFAGDGPEEHVSKLKGMVAESDKVVFTGWLDGDAKNAVLSGAELLVLPSRQENFGLCVMEALSRSVPVLVSPHVNLAEEIVLANAGWIATVDKVALTSRLAEALDDEEERMRRGRAGKQLSQKYSWESAAQSLAELYRDVLRQKNGHAVIH